MTPRYLVRRHGDEWIIVDGQRGFVALARCASQATAEWIAEIMNERQGR